MLLPCSIFVLLYIFVNGKGPKVKGVDSPAPSGVHQCRIEAYARRANRASSVGRNYTIRHRFCSVCLVTPGASRKGDAEFVIFHFARSVMSGVSKMTAETRLPRYPKVPGRTN